MQFAYTYTWMEQMAVGIHVLNERIYAYNWNIPIQYVIVHFIDIYFFGTDDCCFAFNIHWIYQSINHSRATTKPPSNIHLDELLAAVAVGRLMAINRKRPASSWTCPEANGNIRSVRVPTSNCNIDYSKCGHGFVVELANYRHSRASLSKVANVSMN